MLMSLVVLAFPRGKINTNVLKGKLLLLYPLFTLLVIRAENKLGKIIKQNKNEYSNIQLLTHDELVMRH